MGSRLDVQWDFYIGLAIAILLLPVKWLAAWCIAVFMHESAHYYTIKFLGGEISKIRVRVFGASMETGPLPPGKEAVAAIAGPLCAVFIVPFIKYIPRISVCVIIHSIFNLIPLLPLDGGRAIKSLFKNSNSFLRFQKTVASVAVLVGFYISIRVWLGPAPLLLMGLLYFRNRKILLHSEP